MNKHRSNQGQQEQGRAEAERPRYQKRHRPNRLNRPNDASVQIGYAEMSTVWTLPQSKARPRIA